MRHTQVLWVQWLLMLQQRSEKTLGGVEALVRMSAVLTLLSSYQAAGLWSETQCYDYVALLQLRIPEAGSAP